MNTETRKSYSPVGDDALKYLNTLLSTEEQQEVELSAQLMEIIRPERKAKSLSQKELGSICGVSSSTVSRFESGDLSLSITAATKILSALGKRLYIGDIA